MEKWQSTYRAGRRLPIDAFMPSTIEEACKEIIYLRTKIMRYEAAMNLAMTCDQSFVIEEIKREP